MSVLYLLFCSVIDEARPNIEALVCSVAAREKLDSTPREGGFFSEVPRLRELRSSRALLSGFHVPE